MQNNLMNQLGVNSPESKPKVRHLAAISAILATLAGLAVYIAKGEHFLNPIILNATFGVLIIAIVCLLCYSFYPHISEILQVFSKKKRLATLAKMHFKNLDDFADRLEEMASRSNSDSILYVLKKIKKGDQYIAGSLNEFKSMLQAYRFGSNLLRCNGSNYLLLVRWLESLLIFYHNEIICYPVDSIKNSDESIDEKMKDDFIITRETYMKFIHEYIDLSRKTNKAYGENIACEYFQTVKLL